MKLKLKGMSPTTYALAIGLLALIAAGSVMVLILGNLQSTVTITQKETYTTTTTLTTRPPPETATVTVTQTVTQSATLGQTDIGKCTVTINIVNSSADFVQVRLNGAGHVYRRGPYTGFYVFLDPQSNLDNLVEQFRFRFNGGFYVFIINPGIPDVYSGYYILFKKYVGYYVYSFEDSYNGGYFIYTNSSTFSLHVEVVRSAPGCELALDAVTTGGVVKVAPAQSYTVPGSAGAHGPYYFEFSVSGPGGIYFKLTPIMRPDGACREPCALIGRNFTVGKPRCERSLRFVGTNASMIGQDLFRVHPGLKYYVDVMVSGDVSQDNYLVSAAASPDTYVTIMPPNPAQPNMPDQIVRFVLAVSADAPAGHVFTTIFKGWPVLEKQTDVCVAMFEGPQFVVESPSCKAYIDLLETNATWTGSQYAMEQGKVYLFKYRVVAEPSYGVMVVKAKSSQIYKATALEYQVVNPTNYQGNVLIGGDYFQFDGTGGLFVADVVFAVVPNATGTAELGVMFNASALGARPCAASWSRPVVVRGAAPRMCEVKIRAPPLINVYTTGGAGQILVSYNVSVDTTPDGLPATLNIFSPSPIQIAAPNLPYTGTTDYGVTVGMLVPNNAAPNIYTVTYSATASIQGAQCATRNVTLINVTRCVWQIKILNETPVVMEQGRSYIIRVWVSGQPYPAVLETQAQPQAIASITPLWNNAPQINGDGVYDFRVDALAAGNLVLTFTIHSREPFDYCRNSVKADAVVRPREAVCKPVVNISTNMTNTGNGQFQVFPGGRYIVKIGLGGSLPSGNYRLALSFGQPLGQYITWIDPASGYRDFLAPPMPTLEYIFQVDNAAPQGSASPLGLILTPLGTQPCRSAQFFNLTVARPPCLPRMSIQTNATELNGRYYMEPGKVYQFKVSLYVPWAYTPMRLSLSVDSGTVTPGPYLTNPQTGVGSAQQGSRAYFTIQPPNPAQQLSGEFTFYLQPTAETTSLEVRYESEFAMSPDTSPVPRCVASIVRNVTAMVCKPYIKLDTNATVIGVEGDAYSIVVDPGAPYWLSLYIDGVLTYPIARWSWTAPQGISLSPATAQIPVPIPPPRTLVFNLAATAPGTYQTIGQLLVGTSTSPGTAPRLKTCAEIQLKIEASRWDFTVKRDPPGNLTVKAGSVTEAKLYVSVVSGTPRRVYLSVYSAPPGWSASISPDNGVPDYVAAVIINVPAGVQPGTYVVRIKATSGSVTKYHDITVVVS